MNERDTETWTAARPLVAWAWLMGSLLTGQAPDPVAAYLTGAALWFAAGRWSATVRRQGVVAVVLFDLPAIVTISSAQAWPVGLNAAFAAAGLLAGLLSLRRGRAAGEPVPLGEGDAHQAPPESPGRGSSSQRR